MHPALLFSCCAFVAFAAALSAGDAPIDYASIVREINAENGGWSASVDAVPTWMRSMTAQETKRFFTSVEIPEFPAHSQLKSSRQTAENAQGLPTNFSWKDKSGTWGPILDQASCGSCWAFSATTVLSSRYYLATGSAWSTLSSQDLVNCDHTCIGSTTSCNNGCTGGTLPGVWHYLSETGAPSSKCIPYAGTERTCSSYCQDGTTRKNTTRGTDALLTMDPHEMKFLIYRDGPMQTTMRMYSDFAAYSSGIYKHRSGTNQGGHAVTLIGWGSENGEDYWLAQNSWGTSWGMNGFFKISISENNCNFADVSGAGAPRTSMGSRVSTVDVATVKSLAPACSFDSEQVQVAWQNFDTVETAISAINTVASALSGDARSIICRRLFVPVNGGMARPLCRSDCLSYFRSFYGDDTLAAWTCQGLAMVGEAAPSGSSTCSPWLDSDGGGETPPTGLIIGIVIGTVVVAVAAIVGIVWLTARHRRSTMGPGNRLGGAGTYISVGGTTTPVQSPSALYVQPQPTPAYAGTAAPPAYVDAPAVSYPAIPAAYAAQPNVPSL
ncbi:putative thiol protease aleurain [Paratrimastix pyriformis]|uniref:Thiol protease aleurain n=1 Tax=Paratrimastix pyriformis TaxID=342808 RepID=A0ABQ8UUF0_9EUKA|nr:putative thiol protease aleurain [Paratrimastix pyriformis]